MKQLIWSMCLCSSAVLAQTLSPPPKLAHQSAFAHYQKWAEPNPTTWRGANDLVTRIGGWREYLKEVQTSEPDKPKTEEKAHEHKK